MNNLSIRQFELTIEEFINKSELPIEVKRLVLSEIKQGIDKEADSQIILEAKEVQGGENI